MSQPEYSPNPPAGAVIIDTPTHHVAFCDECRSAKVFTTAKAREQWLKFHPHEVNA